MLGAFRRAGQKFTSSTTRTVGGSEIAVMQLQASMADAAERKEGAAAELQPCSNGHAPLEQQHLADPEQILRHLLQMIYAHDNKESAVAAALKAVMSLQQEEVRARAGRPLMQLYLTILAHVAEYSGQQGHSVCLISMALLAQHACCMLLIG